ncbi:nicotinate-nucleotide adenylyltransferase [Aliiglaciecola sp. CAU 1673]|uniref:nicotinate-nucleotide adenylyltransferase n=1 Tax=Aliiglaciecola sp. CAU 1673 TaxID=3032595 RepID=UPI0023DA2445|nr:nicotinate-nucleotide adenylyltransferase [Aliiglaciecola sp. CAU 1673]MDF2179338.1 nicotinate-nucleotide adenylyltransferase [Aliiglaciecola sp. CAU 1673]
MSALGLFGGTFDPVHYGHLKPVAEAAKEVGLVQIRLLPCHIPPHKATPSVSASMRLHMLRLVCEDWPLFEVDDRELRRHKPSYSVDTLNEYREEVGDRPLLFFMGMDSLQTLHTWYRWQEILSLCHLVVCRRGESKPTMAVEIQDLLDRHQCHDAAALHHQPAGSVYLASTSFVNLSSTSLRQKLASGKVESALLPPKVLTYIQEHGLYGCEAHQR